MKGERAGRDGSAGPAGGARPLVTVCVSTRDRARLLERLAAALESQTVGIDRFEVVITDDGSADDTWAVLDRLRASTPLRLRTLRNDVSGGPAAGRNRAWRAARAPVVVFTDDDCVPDPRWLQAHVDAIETADVTQGRVLFDPAQEGNFGAFSRAVTVADENGLYETCNIAYRRTWLERLGGFDERFVHSGEDADLGWRAREAGAVTRFVPEALVLHDVQPPSWRRALRDTHRWIGVVHLVDRHPSLARRFRHGFFWRPAHAPAIVALGGTVGVAAGTLTRSWPVAVAGLTGFGPYLWYRLAREPVSGSRRERLVLLGAAWVLDLWEIVTIGRASLGTRRRRGRVAGGRHVAASTSR